MPKNATIEHFRLKNGLRVVYSHTPDSCAFEIAIHINTGSRDETAKNNGISHFLEHMMFRGSNRHPNSLLLSKQLESFGGETNAVTGLENTTYWIKGNTNKILEAIECFSEFFLFPNFSDLEIEKNIILQELASDYNDSGTCIDCESLAMAALFKGHPLGLPILGIENSIKSLNISDLEEKRKVFYNPKNCIITINSHLSSQLIFKQLELCFDMNWSHTTTENVSNRESACSIFQNKDPGKKPQNALSLQNNDDNQFSIKLIFPTYGGISKETVHVNFLQFLLDDGMGSRLSANIREKHGLAYDVSCDAQFFYDIGTFSLDALTSKQNLELILKSLSEEVEKLLNEKAPQEELDRVKYRYHFYLKQTLENHSQYLTREATSLFTSQNPFSIDQEDEIVQAITADDITKIAQSIFSAPKRGFVLVGPQPKKKRDAIEKFLSHFDKI